MKRFAMVFAAIIVVLAGAVSYLADSDPDGLDTVTLRGCEVVHTQGRRVLRGSCIAQHADEHALADGPLAGYTVFGNAALTGVAGVLGVIATAALAGGVCWALRRRRATRGQQT